MNRSKRISLALLVAATVLFLLVSVPLARFTDWYTERDRVFDGGWHQVTIRRRQISFAWGPKGGASSISQIS